MFGQFLDDAFVGLALVQQLVHQGPELRRELAETRAILSLEIDRADLYANSIPANAKAALDAAVAAAWENAAKIAEAKALEFLSPEYATGQPFSSFSERFACEQVAAALRAAGKENVSTKTAESGHSPSTREG